METDTIDFSQKNNSIIHKVYELYLVFYKINEKIPKKDRYTLGIKIEKLIIDLLELFFLALNEYGEEKNIILNKSDIKLKTIKLMIRLAYEIKTISQDEYILLEKKVLEIGKMLGGWIKSENTKRP